MPKSRVPSAGEYAHLKRFFVFWCERHPPAVELPPEHHPLAGLELLEKTSMSRARAGLRMAINDIIEMSLHRSPMEVAKLDSELRSLGIVTLSEIRRHHGRQFARILKRGRIRDETEYYLVRNVLNDRAETSAEERALLTAMIDGYESTVVLSSPKPGRRESG